MKDKIEVGLITAGEIVMYLKKYAELIETIEKSYGVCFFGHDDPKRPREIADRLHKEGYEIEKALWEEHHKGETYPIAM